MQTSEYEQQAKNFLERFGLTFRANKHPNQTPPPWLDNPKNTGRQWSEADGEYVTHGIRWIITITKGQKPGRIEFDFWGSIADRCKPASKFKDYTKPTAYDVLACISGDASAPDDPDEVAAEFGIVKPSQAWEIVKFGRKLRKFFTQEELEALSEIQ